MRREFVNQVSKLGFTIPKKIPRNIYLQWTLDGAADHNPIDERESDKQYSGGIYI